MTDKEDINDQLELLRAYRRTLTHYLRQEAIHGVAMVPPAVEHGIRETREHIRQIKNYLRDHGTSVEDFPGDDWPSSTAGTPWGTSVPAYATKAASLAAHRGRMVDREAELGNF